MESFTEYQALAIQWISENYSIVFTALIVVFASIIVLSGSFTAKSSTKPSSLENDLFDADLSKYMEEFQKTHSSIKSIKTPWEIGVSSKSVSVSENGVLRVIEFTLNLSRPTPEHLVKTLAKAILNPVEKENKVIGKPSYVVLLDSVIFSIKERSAVAALLKPFSIKSTTLAELEKEYPEIAKFRFATGVPPIGASPVLTPAAPTGPQAPIPFNPAPSRGCLTCKKDIVGKASQCSACKAVIYDSVDCAKKDWANHKQSCAAFKICMDHITEWKMHEFPFDFYNSSKILHNYNIVPFLTSHSIHNVGLFQRLCGCFAQAPWGGLNATRLLKFHSSKPTPEQMFQDYGLFEEMFPLSRDFPADFDISALTSWEAYYLARGYSLSNPAALILEVPLTIWYLVYKFYLPTAPAVQDGVKRKITIHLLGAEKEADLLPLFECLLPLFPRTDIAIHMIGNRLQTDISPAQRAMAIRSVKNESSVFMSVTSGLYQPQHLDGTAFKLPADVPQEILQSQNFGEGRPDLIIALNAELVVHGEWFPALSIIAKSGVRFLVSERMEQLCLTAEANLPKANAKMTIKTHANPFRQPLFEFRKDVNLPGKGIAPFRMHSLEYDDFITFFERYKVAKPPVYSMDLDYLKKGLELFLEFQKKKLAALSEKMRLQREALPVKLFQEQIVECVKNNRVTLIAADTGAGKSTQVPQYLMEAGFSKIGVTQPRRIACYSLAKRVGQESLNRYGSKVGHQVRFDVSKTGDTKILFLTEGLLLKQFSVDPLLKAYDVLIVDEVHERHLTGDFLLGILKRLLTYRLDIRILLMSATIQSELFSNYFKAPIIQIPGRMYPVSISYISVDEKDRNLTDKKFFEERKNSTIKQSIPARPLKLNVASYLKILDMIDETVPEFERGDLLVFVSGMNEISILADFLAPYAASSRKWIVLQLHSSLSVQQQEKVFDIAPEGVRKCIISTNIAETSVTIDGIRFIIDSGKVKEMGYDSSLGLSKLKEYWISQSSAKQRAGRAGRTGPGQCFRLYDKDEYEAFNDFPVPEIQRTMLDTIVLQIISLDLGSPYEFDFLERPSETALEHSIAKLVDLGCLTESETSVTAMGRVLSLLPVDIILGKMLVLGSISSLLKPVLAIAAVLSIQSPFARLAEGNHSVMTKRKSFYSDHGDPFTLLNLFSGWLEIKTRGGYGESKKYCRSLGVEEQRLYEAVKLKDQFEKILASHQLADFFPPDIKVGKEERIQKRIIEKRKLENRESARKFLKIEDEIYNGIAEEGDHLDGGIPEIEELEFNLKTNPDALWQDSDVSSLNQKELTILKLIVCSGLYPNVAIPDEANYARSASEQVFHTKNQRFLSMIPDSVFAFSPEILHGKPVHGYYSTSLHEKRFSKDVLCYVSLLETTKPYLMSVVRIEALPLILLFSHEIIVGPDCLHLLADGWLHIEFFDAETARKALELGAILRYVWQTVIQDKLSLQSSGDEEIYDYISAKYKLDHLVYIPPCMTAARNAWFENSCGLCKAKSDTELMDQLVDLVEIDVVYNVEKLKMTSVNDLFGFNPFEAPPTQAVKVTPHFTYLLHSPNLSRDNRLFLLPSTDLASAVLPSTSKVPEVPINSERLLFECPYCFKSLFLFPSEYEAHLEACR